MSNLVDTYILRPKEVLSDKKEILKRARTFPKEEQNLLKYLLELGISLKQIIECDIYGIQDLPFEWEDTWISLKQSLRKGFYRTLYIVTNDYDCDKLDRFFVLEEDKVACLIKYRDENIDEWDRILEGLERKRSPKQEEIYRNKHFITLAIEKRKATLKGIKYKYVAGRKIPKSKNPKMQYIVIYNAGELVNVEEWDRNLS